MSYRHRVIDSQLDQLLAHVAAIAIEGPKGVGKTETASRRASTVMQLDSAQDAAAIAADPTFTSFETPCSSTSDKNSLNPGIRCAVL